MMYGLFEMLNDIAVLVENFFKQNCVLYKYQTFFADSKQLKLNKYNKNWYESITSIFTLK